MVGDAKVERSSDTKLLGIIIDDKQKWNEHFSELTNALNKRTFAIRRVSNQIPKTEVLRVVQSLWMSKLRYGLQLCNQVRCNPEDPSNNLMDAVQVAQNKMLRMLDRVTLKDHVSSISLLQKYNLPSVNQLAAQIKLIQAWKSQNIDLYQLKLELNNPNRTNVQREIRQGSIKMWKDEAKTAAAKVSFSRDNAPEHIKQALTLNKAKKEIIKYCTSLEV